jgi:16S rRNA (guanine966-N2)-methyltransferase
MRILGGSWAGRTLVSPSGRVRPTAEAVRAAVVPLADQGLREAGLPEGLAGARVADLFAGTGAVGIELLSRGAGSCDFVEHDPSALHALKANVAGLRVGSGRARIHVRDAIPFVESPPRPRGPRSGRPGRADRPDRPDPSEAPEAPVPDDAWRWDLAYADPPWGSRKLDRVLAGWLARPWSKLLLLEHAADRPLEPLDSRPRRVRVVDRIVGDAKLTLLRAPLILLALLALGTSMAGCERTPRVNAPEPELRDDPEDLDRLPISMLRAPVIYDLRSAVEAMEDAVPRAFGALDERHAHPGNDRVHVAFEVERSPFEWSLTGDTARITTTLSYRGRGWYDPPLAPEVSASCGTGDDETRPRANLTLVSPLTVDAEWRLRSNARVESIVPASDDGADQCTVTVFNIDVTERVLSAAQGFLESNASRIDEEVARVDLEGRLQGVWERLLEPHELTDDVWLQVTPTSISLGEIQGEGNRVNLAIAVGASPRLVLGPRPEWIPTPLPPLGSGVAGEGLRILLDARGHYAEAGERLTREFGNRSFEWGGQTFRIREATLQGIGEGKVALGVRFEGSARGRLFLIGTPELDHEAGEIHVPDLEFDVETLNLLMRSAAWIARGDLVRTLREEARLPVSEILDFAREKLLEGLNRELSDQVRLEGEVLSVELLGVRATAAGLQVRAASEARATIVVSAP